TDLGSRLSARMARGSRRPGFDRVPSLTELLEQPFLAVADGVGVELVCRVVVRSLLGEAGGRVEQALVCAQERRILLAMLEKDRGRRQVCGVANGLERRDRGFDVVGALLRRHPLVEE